ncbi:hypothetical protein B0H66DRAFT_520240 [Apodospora peruviana]|uniref:Ecp2 effector protein domain-containing protein n=1 Tax=Apodospora peruviana TaxID=516989 RepID=A0AAE0M2L6_9PEZI|nr:hypothetical protein B0H66DRAFT_520240 [Apodospora peruviana]
MHSQIFISALVAFFSAIPTVTALPSPVAEPSIGTFETVTEIPDGLWSGYTLPNGTMVATSHLSKRTIIFHPPQDTRLNRRSESLSKRFTSCWGTQLDRYGTDEAAQCLRNAGAAPGGIDLRTPSGSGLFTSCVSAAVRVYYCVNKPNSWGNANLEDVNYGLRQMDAACPAYTAGYFQWDGTPEILGKARADTSICLP